MNGVFVPAPTGYARNDAQDASRYLEETVEVVLRPMLASVSLERPADPVQHMLDWLWRNDDGSGASAARKRAEELEAEAQEWRELADELDAKMETQRLRSELEKLKAERAKLLETVDKQAKVAGLTINKMMSEKQDAIDDNRQMNLKDKVTPSEPSSGNQGAKKLRKLLIGLADQSSEEEDSDEESTSESKDSGFNTSSPVQNCENGNVDTGSTRVGKDGNSLHSMRSILSTAKLCPPDRGAQGLAAKPTTMSENIGLAKVKPASSRSSIMGERTCSKVTSKLVDLGLGHSVASDLAHALDEEASADLCREGLAALQRTLMGVEEAQRLTLDRALRRDLVAKRCFWAGLKERTADRMAVAFDLRDAGDLVQDSGAQALMKFSTRAKAKDPGLAREVRRDLARSVAPTLGLQEATADELVDVITDEELHALCGPNGRAAMLKAAGRLQSEQPDVADEIKVDLLRSGLVSASVALETIEQVAEVSSIADCAHIAQHGIPGLLDGFAKRLHDTHRNLARALLLDLLKGRAAALTLQLAPGTLDRLAAMVQLENVAQAFQHQGPLGFSKLLLDIKVEHPNVTITVVLRTGEELLRARGLAQGLSTETAAKLAGSIELEDLVDLEADIDADGHAELVRKLASANMVLGLTVARELFFARASMYQNQEGDQQTLVQLARNLEMTQALRLLEAKGSAEFLMSLRSLGGAAVEAVAHEIAQGVVVGHTRKLGISKKISAQIGKELGVSKDSEMWMTASTPAEAGALVFKKDPKQFAALRASLRDLVCAHGLQLGLPPELASHFSEAVDEDSMRNLFKDPSPENLLQVCRQLEGKQPTLSLDVARALVRGRVLACGVPTSNADQIAGEVIFDDLDHVLETSLEEATVHVGHRAQDTQPGLSSKILRKLSVVWETEAKNY